MKKHTKFFAFIMVVLVLATSIITLKDVIAVESTNYRTTIINEDGLEIEIATIRSEDIIGTEEYIKANLNTAYANSEKFEPKDAIYVKHLLADGTEFSGEKTIDAMYDGQEDAFIMMNDFATILYETDENSEYYVAFVNTLIDDPDYQVTDHCFAYTNLDGEEVFNCIYDNSTGLVYVPKKYTEENKNGVGMNTQVELLQVIDNENPTSTLSVKVDVDENVVGTFASSGKITVEALATEFGVRVALDDEAINDITENYFKVMVNDTQTHAYKYYPDEGIIVVQALPNTIKTLEINISPDNIDDNVDYLMENGGVSAYATWEDIPVYGAPGEWFVTTMPNEGDSWYIESNPADGFNADMVDVYHAGAVHFGDSLPIYNEATDTDWAGIVDKIWNGGTVDLGNLVQNGTWIQHEVRFNRDVTANGITIPGGTVAWLKCSHAKKSFVADNDRGTDPVDGEPRDHAWKIKIKIYKITNDYMIVGFLTSILHSQAGTGIYKIAYTTGKGNLEVAKVDKNNNYIPGAKFSITGKDVDYYNEVTTTADKNPYPIENLDKGTYIVQEIQAPNNMVINRTPVEVTVKSNETAYAQIRNEYPRGSVRLVKYDADHRGATLGDATLAGAVFNLYAAQDIYEGSERIYTKDEVVSTVTTDAAGNTPAVTNLPIGSYYYREISASTGFLLNTNVVNVSVDYAGQDTAVISEKLGEIAEPPMYANIQITKKLGALDYDPEINLRGAQFKATLKSDTSQVYYSTVSGADGICRFTGIPYGVYTIEEYVVPAAAEKIANFDVNVIEHGKTYTYTITDPSKDMKIAVTKNLVVENNWKTDAKAEGAIFTVYRDAACTNIVCTIGPTDARGYAISQGTMRTGTYYLKETTFPVGLNPDAVIPGENVTYRNKVYRVTSDNTKQGTELVTVPITITNVPVYGNISIRKKLGALDYDPEINLRGARFKATLKSDRTQVYYSTISGNDGLCTFTKLPYGEYTIEEYITPPEAEKIDNFDVMVSEEGKTYEYTRVDKSKDMKIEVFKEILVQAGEKTDAVVSGAEFTVYRDAACTNKVCVIGPTDATGYAISGTMRTGTYYVKETKFPTGIDPDATIPGENVTYRNKVYVASYDNKAQGTELVTISLNIINEPKRNDLEIFKEIGKTTNTPQFPLDQCEFTATLKSSIGTDNVFSRKCTAPTDRNGYCIIEDLPYGEYIVEETKVSPISLKCENFTIFIKEDQKVQTTPYYKNIVDEPKVMQIKIRKVDANRKSTDAPDFTQGDATLEGAIYEIYRYDPQTDDYTEKVYDITVDHKDSEGYWCAESGDLLVGKYMVKEKISYSETVDGKTYNYSYAEGYLSDPETYYFEQRPDLQPGKRTYHYDTSKEEVIRGSVEVIKYDNILGSTEEVASKGAILRLTLDSNPSKYYDVVINAEGYGEFVEEESREKYYPHTIPFGEYTITEIKESDAEEHTSFFIQPEKVVIEKNVQKEYRIESDEPVQMYLQIQKTDKHTGANVHLTGAKFKVWNCEKGEWVSQMLYPKGEYIEQFEVLNEDGHVTLPYKLEAGAYIIYETESPKGYYLEENFRIPAEKDIGNPDVAGKYILIDKAAMGVEENTPANTIDLYYKAYIPNSPSLVKLEIIKTGEMLTDATVETTTFGDRYTPVYNQKGLEDVTYNIIAAEDIKSPDGRVTYVSKDTIVDTITTNEQGIAATKDLYPGEYKIVETAAPEGYLINTDIPNVVLTNDNTLQRVEVTTKELSNVRQKLKLTFPKRYEEINYANAEDAVRYSVFGVYANEDIKNSEGTIVISKNDLVDIIRIEGNETDATSTIDLPEGNYYVKELEASYPYTVSTEKKYVELKYSGNVNEYVTYPMSGFDNTYPKASLAMIKLSTSAVKDLVVNGNAVDQSKFDARVIEILDALKMMTISEAEQYLKENNIKFVADAKYEIYVDEECTQPLYIRSGEEFVKAELKTNEYGMMVLENIPLGKYYLKEVEAPQGYELSEEVTVISLTNEDKDQLTYRALKNVANITQFISKVDIFTSEVISNCIFEIRDENDKVLLHSITDEQGIAYIPTDIFEEGKKYKYVEIEAPEIYELNTEPHEFTAKFDENGLWDLDIIKVENTRKDSTVTFEKLDFADSTPIPNCKFELRSLETDFVVEGVTDENGIYVFENIPYGKYTYQEIEAPEEYIIDTEVHEVTIDAEEMKLQITNEKKVEPPATGDMQVATLASIFVISALGLAYVLKTKKQLVK